MLSKLGFNPESFSRGSVSDDIVFSRSFQRKTMSERIRTSASSPLTWGLAAIGLYFGHRLKGEDPSSLIPTFTGALLVVIALKRWTNASQREKQRFVKEYNAKMGTTFTIKHAKMQALWDLAHANKNKVNHLSKYAAHKPVQFQPTEVYQQPGFDRNSVWRRIKSKSVSTSQAIRALGEEWMDRPPPKGVYKERWIPLRVGSHHKNALYKYASRTKKFSNRRPDELQILADMHAANQLSHVALSDTRYPAFRRWYKNSKQTQDLSPKAIRLANRHYREAKKVPLTKVAISTELVNRALIKAERGAKGARRGVEKAQRLLANRDRQISLFKLHQQKSLGKTPISELRAELAKMPGTGRTRNTLSRLEGWGFKTLEDLRKQNVEQGTLLKVRGLGKKQSDFLKNVVRDKFKFDLELELKK